MTTRHTWYIVDSNGDLHKIQSVDLLTALRIVLEKTGVMQYYTMQELQQMIDEDTYEEDLGISVQEHASFLDEV